MPVEKVKDREVPWCTVILVVGALTCHACVLAGNLITASAMEEIGQSTKGWSRVGLGLARSFNAELDVQMAEMSEELLDSLGEISKVQGLIDSILTMVGGVADNETSPDTAMALLKQAKARPEHAPALLLQANSKIGPFGGGDDTKPAPTEGAEGSSALAPLVNQGIEDVATSGVELLKSQVTVLMDKLRPALEKAGEWILKFGSKIQQAVDTFSGSLDKVQKLFDNIMAQLNGGGEGEDLMIQQTFGLFDVSGTGYVSPQDLVDVSELYSISALAGEKGPKLVAKYDADGDGQLRVAEFAVLITDESIPNVMAVVLRTYARRLSEVAGNVASAKMRDEVAMQLVNYLGLVCAKNMTKVGWVSDTLTNSSVPEEFSAAVLAQMCLSADNPAAITGKDVGQTVTSEMYRLNPPYTVQLSNLLSDTEWWVSEGFDPLDQPGCVEMVTGWVATAKANQTSSLLQLDDAAARTAAMDKKVLDAMPLVAHRLAEQNMRSYMFKRRQARAEHRASLYTSATSQLLLDRLLGGVAASDVSSGASSPAERALAAGNPAAPETLQFVLWLSYNASTNADIFQEYCFAYSSQSSTQTDTFATQITSMVKQMQSFLDMMMKYATPEGIQKLEDLVIDVVDGVGDAILNIIEQKVEPFVNKTLPMAELGLKKVAYDTGADIGLKLSSSLTQPFKDAVEGPLNDIFEQIPGGSGAALSQKLSDTVSLKLQNLTGDVLADKVGHMLEDLVDQALEEAADKLDEHVGEPDAVMLTRNAQGKATLTINTSAVMAMEHDTKTMIDEDQLQSFVTTLSSLNNLLPQATKTVKFARTQVSKASKNMESIFNQFEAKGPKIFDDVAMGWRLVWTMYFFFLLPGSLGLLYYGFWAGGYFGGPQPIDDGEDVPAPVTFSDKFRVCCSGCCACMQKFHDTQTCFWSAIIVFQVLVLIIFILSIVLCIIGGVKTFMLSGCAQIYVLGDAKVCAGILKSLNSWLEGFHVQQLGESFEPLCVNTSLVTCKVISSKMKQSVILTTVFSLVGTVLSLQMLIESAILHEMARFRRMVKAMAKESSQP